MVSVLGRPAILNTGYMMPLFYSILFVDTVRIVVQSPGESSATEVVPSLPPQGEKENTERARIHYPVQEIKDVQLPGVQGIESGVQEV